MNNNDAHSNVRQNNYDLMRIVCSVCVVMIHVNAGWLFRDRQNLDVWSYRIEEFFNIITRFSVPCFIMLSGAFNLNNRKNAETTWFYTKSLKKLLPPLVLVTIFWIIQMVSNSENTPKTIFLRILKVDYGNLWFMPMLIGLYMITPFMVRCIKLFTKCELYVLIVVIGFWACISQYTTAHLLPYDNGNVVSYLFYYILGYLIYTNNSYCNEKKRGKSFIYVLSIVILACIGVFIRNKVGIIIFDKDPYVSFFSPIVVAISIITMIMFKNIDIRHNWSVLASLTYCVYLFHTPIIFFYKKIVLNHVIMPELMHVIFEWAVVTLLSFAFSLLYKNIENKIKMHFK